MPELNIERAVQLAKILVKEVIADSKGIEKMQGRTCVAICIADHGGFPIAVFLIGTPASPQKGRDYFEMAQKKCRDLAVLILSGARSTRAYKDDAWDRYPGGVAGKSLLISTSGFTGNQDENISAGILVGLNDLKVTEAVAICVDNPHPQTLRRVLGVVHDYLV
jgi:hypothetical protein